MTTPTEQAKEELSNHTEDRLMAYLRDLKKRREDIEAKIEFCARHKFQEEARWLSKQANLLSSEYVEINNKVLGIYF